jgi:REP element-mobilizing transposase RayT
MTISFVTTTSHGTWLPGDARGYVRKGRTLPGDSEVFALSKIRIETPPVCFSLVDRNQLFSALLDPCAEFNYKLSDAAIESWHLHWILFHGNDAIEVVVGRLKNRMRQRLARGRIWTEGYYAEPLFDNNAIEQVQQYIARHAGCRMSDGRIVADGNEPRQSRGLTAAKYR